MPSSGANRTAAVLALLILTGSSLIAFAMPSPTQGATTTQAAPKLYDDFTHDTRLNTTLWQVNGSVGSTVGLHDAAGTSVVLLKPTFSSAGMEIAQVNRSLEVGTIQSIETFSPPFTVTAVVEGVISNGHTFGFAISAANAGSGVLIYGNLNSTNCSNLGNCGDPSTCGTSANPSIPPNQCYYGMDAKVGRGNGSWTHQAKLFLNPNVDIFYTLQISVDTSGNAQYSVSQGGQVLGQSTAQVGTGPFYLIMEQAEGSPVAKPGPNQAYWMSVSLTPTSPGPSPSGISVYIWIVVVIIILFLFLIILLWFRRRRLTVNVLDSQKLSPIQGAAVSASGPKNLSGTTERNGRVVFSNPKKGEYSIQATCKGYNASVPAKVTVKNKTEHTVRLTPVEGGTPAAANVGLPTEGPQVTIAAPSGQQAQIPGPSGTQVTEPATTQAAVQESPDIEGWGGSRIREIIKTFQEKGAVSPETALTAKELGLSRLFVRIMQRRRGKTMIFIEVNGKYYLNQKALQETQL